MTITGRVIVTLRRKIAKRVLNLMKNCSKFWMLRMDRIMKGILTWTILILISRLSFSHIIKFSNQIMVVEMTFYCG